MNEMNYNGRYIHHVETWNSGGNVMLDVIHLRNGNILVISDEFVCRYDSIEHFMEAEYDDNFDKNCIELEE